MSAVGEPSRSSEVVRRRVREGLRRVLVFDSLVVLAVLARVVLREEVVQFVEGGERPPVMELVLERLERLESMERLESLERLQWLGLVNMLMIMKVTKVGLVHSLVHQLLLPGARVRARALWMLMQRDAFARPGRLGAVGEVLRRHGPTSSSSSSSSSLDVALAGLGMRGPSASSAAAKSTKQLGAWLPLGDVVVRAGGDVDVVVAERRGILTGFAKRKHLKMLPVAADEVLEFGVRVQRAPPRGPDLTEVFPVAHEAPHADLVWDHRAMGDLGAERAELRLMNAMPTISSHKKNEMLSSAMGMIKAQQEKAAAAAASPPPSSEQANDA